MNKFIKFCQKPLLIIAAIVFGIFTIGLIVTSVVPYATTTYSYTEENKKEEFKVDGKKCYIKTFKDGTEIYSAEFFYKVEDGVLYVGETEDNITWATGKIQISSYQVEITSGTNTTVYKNGFTNAMRVVDIVMMVISGLALAGSITLIVLDKKGKLKTSK